MSAREPLSLPFYIVPQAQHYTHKALSNRQFPLPAQTIATDIGRAGPTADLSGIEHGGHKNNSWERPWIWDARPA